MHHLDDFVSGDVFGKRFDVGWIGTWASGWSRGLRGWRVLSQGDVSRERHYAHYYERTSMESIHSGDTFSMRMWSAGSLIDELRIRFVSGSKF
jgi:hypothetical protein